MKLEELVPLPQKGNERNCSASARKNAPLLHQARFDIRIHQASQSLPYSIDMLCYSRGAIQESKGPLEAAESIRNMYFKKTFVDLAALSSARVQRTWVLFSYCQLPALHRQAWQGHLSRLPRDFETLRKASQI